jgi:Starch-binding associating with outer membrane
MKKIVQYIALLLCFLPTVSCNDYLDVNRSPNSVLDAPLANLMPAATVSIGFLSGSDLHRFSALLVQQFSGQGQGATTQTQEFERYNIQGSDLNNLWLSIFSGSLSDLNQVIIKAGEQNSPHFAGVAKILQAYLFQLAVDAWGQIPYSEALKYTENLSPKFDDGESVYPALINLINAGIADINAATSVRSPDASSSTIYPGGWAASKPRWERLANTLKLRLLIHQTKSGRAAAIAEITRLVNANTAFMATSADNFQMSFVNLPRAQNPIHQFENDRANQFFPNNTLVSLMNGKSDPRRFRYFTPFPFTRNLATAQFRGAKGGDAPATTYSRMHTYLRGDTTNTTAVTAAANGSILNTAYTYTGSAPIRMLTFAEYNFIRAEAAVLGAPGNAETFYQAGIRASMADAGVPTAQIDAYITANGTLPTADADKIKAIIEEKYVANYGVIMEPWTDWRRTGFPALTPPSNALIPTVPRSLFFPQSEIDLNPNAPRQKADMTVRVFWDK